MEDNSTPLIYRTLLGDQFLAYVLGVDDDTTVAELLSMPERLTPEQAQVIAELDRAFKQVPENVPPQTMVSAVLGRYRVDSHIGVPRFLRAYVGQNSSAPHDNDPVLDELLQVLVDAYPLLLIPEADGAALPAGMAHTGSIFFSHPRRQQLEMAVLEDSALGRYFYAQDDMSGHRGSYVSSSGHGGGIQLWSFASSQITSAWQECIAVTPSTPSFDVVANMLRKQLKTIRAAAVGKSAQITAFVGLAGILIPDGTEIDLGWGTIRAARDADASIHRNVIEGQLASPDADGRQVTMQYVGDVVLETKVDYVVKIGDFDIAEEWPVPNSYERIERRLESLRLALLLAGPDGSDAHDVIVPTWRSIFDPLAMGNGINWSDSRGKRLYTPRTLSVDEVIAWLDMAKIVEEYRTQSVNIAIRRTLQASAERTDMADVLLDSVVAWENLVGSRQETTFKVTAALSYLFFPDDSEKRKDLYRDLKKIYSVRSNLVHGSTPLEGKKGYEDAECALSVAIKALRIIFTERIDLLSKCKDGGERSDKLILQA